MLSHRHHIVTLLQALFVLCSFSACINDEFADDVAGKRNSNTKPYYLTLMIESVDNSSQTRSTFTDGGEEAQTGDFVHGTENEHVIGSNGNFVILFDKEDKLFSVVLLEEGHNDNPGHNNDFDPDNYIEALYKAKIYPDDEAEDENEKWPHSCLVVMNGASIFSELASAQRGAVSKDDILNKIWQNSDPTKIGRDNDGYFTMTNSVYLDKDNYGNMYVKDTVQISEVNYPDLETNKEGEAVHVHVERMVAKFSFKETDAPENHIYTPQDNTILYCNKFTDDTGKEGDIKSHAPEVDEREFRVKLTGWGMNAFETQNHLFKKIKNKNPEYYSGWNDSYHFRSYWSEDPHYDYEAGGNTPLKYPWQYRLAVDSPLDFYKEKEGETEEAKMNYLKNYSFTNLNDGDFAKVVYTPENTYDPTIYGSGTSSDGMEENFDSRTELLAGTHLIVGAELQIDFKDGNSYVTPEHLYRDRTNTFYTNQRDCFWSLVRVFNLDLNSNYETKYRLYNWEATKGSIGETRKALTMQNDYYYYDESSGKWDDSKTPTGQDTNIGTYKLYREVDNQFIEVTYEYIMGLPEDTQFFISADVKNGDGKVLPWLSGLTIMSDNGTGTLKPLRIFDEISIQYTTSAPNVDGGKPVIVGNMMNKENDYKPTENDIKSIIYDWMGAVDHFNEGKMYYAAPVKHKAADVVGTQYEADRSKLADYGVVRNNWYRFNLNGITKIGTSIDNPEEPIVPNIVRTQDQLNISVYIIPWHTLGTTASVIQ